MIFKRLFKPKYQDPNPKVRIEAIAKLDASDPSQKTQLHELAFNDDDAGVILASMQKLNSFALWNKLAETSKLERVRKKAKNVVESALFESGEISVSEKEKRTYLEECNNNSILEKALQQPWVQQGEHLLVNKILTKLDKPNFTRQFFFNCTDTELQQQLVLQFDDESTLQKVVKRCVDPALIKYAKEKLADINRLKQKPPEIEKQAKLVLAQLLALKDKTDFALIQKTKQELTDSFVKISTEFDCLAAVKAQELRAKYDNVIAKLELSLEKIGADWHARQHELEKQQAIEKLETLVSGIISEVSDTLAADASKITLGQVEQFEGRIELCIADLELQSSQLISLPDKVLRKKAHAKIEQLFNLLNQCKATLEHLPEFQQAIGNAQTFLAKFSALELPSDLSQVDASELYLKEQSQAWNALTQPYKDTWPAGLSSQWNEIYKSWRAAVNKLKSQLKQDVSRVRSKLKAVDNLISQGKYKAAMGLYERVQVWYFNIPEFSRSHLQRTFESSKEKIENLKDWQDYIAQPRKPALLKEVEALIESPLSIEKQAQSVKDLRKQWNTLGKLDTESDIALNSAFDDLIEKAFEPCRVHYAKQKLEREENLAAKHTIIEHLNQLSSNETGGTELLNQYRDLQSKWKKVGNVDYRQLDTLNDQFTLATAPIRRKLDTFFDVNTEAKNNLIKKAQKLIDEEPASAVEAAKTLQLEWKKTETAGKKRDNQLWAQFRSVNDQIFAKRNEAKAESRKLTDDKLAAVEAQLIDLETELSSASDKAAIGHALDKSTELENTIKDLPAKLQSKYFARLNKLHDTQSTMLKTLAKDKTKQQFALLFEILSQWNSDALPDEVSDLPSKWQQWFKSASASPQMDRHHICVQLEIVAEASSPDSDSQQRKTLQMQMMAEKLQQGNVESKQTLLEKWIAQGPLTSKDVALLPRIQALF